VTDLVLSVEVGAPAGTTWLALTDWARQGEWMLATHVKVVEGNGRSVGTKLAAFTGLAGIGFTDTMEITSWEPPVRCAVRHLGTVVQGTGVFQVVSKGASTSTLIWAEHLRLPFGPLGRLGWPVLRPPIALGVRQSLRRFARFAADYSVGGK
jgi:hypothetical protein